MVSHICKFNGFDVQFSGTIDVGLQSNQENK
jgi:hypothetical protein